MWISWTFRCSLPVRSPLRVECDHGMLGVDGFTGLPCPTAACRSPGWTFRIIRRPQWRMPPRQPPRIRASSLRSASEFGAGRPKGTAADTAEGAFKPVATPTHNAGDWELPAEFSGKTSSFPSDLTGKRMLHTKYMPCRFFDRHSFRVRRNSRNRSGMILAERRLRRKWNARASRPLCRRILLLFRSGERNAFAVRSGHCRRETGFPGYAERRSPRSRRETNLYEFIPGVVNSSFDRADSLLAAGNVDSAAALVEEFTVLKPLWEEWTARALRWKAASVPRRFQKPH